MKRDILVWEDSVEGEDAFSESEEEVVEGMEVVVTDQEAEATTQHRLNHPMKLHQFKLKQGFEEHLFTCRTM